MILSNIETFLDVDKVCVNMGEDTSTDRREEVKDQFSKALTQGTHLTSKPGRMDQDDKVSEEE